MSWPFNTPGAPAREPAKTAPSLVERTTASNGVTIVSHDLNDPVSLVGFYNKHAGAKFDPRSKPGLNFVMRCSLMQSNMDDSAFQFDKLVRSAGGSFEHQEIRKKYLGWKLEVQRDAYKPIFNFMCNGIAVPRFQSVEIDRYRDTMDNIYEELRFKTPRQYCVERLEQISFYKEPLGQSRYVLPSSNDYCSPEGLLNHYSAIFDPENVILVGLNVNHRELVNAFEASSYKLSKSAPHFQAADVSVERAYINSVAKGEAREKTQYIEQSESIELEKRSREMTTNPLFIDETIFAIGWCTNGASGIAKYAATLVALQYLDIALGTATHQRDGREEDIQTFYTPYQTAGMMGMTARVHPEKARDAQNRVLKTMETASALTSAHESAVQRAMLRFHHDHLELRRDYADFLATSDESAAPADVMKALQGVKPRDVMKVFDGCRSRRPSQFATGTHSTLTSLRKLL